MRRFIDIVALAEAVETADVPGHGPVRVHRNPSLAEFRAAAKDAIGSLRGILCRNGDTFWWDAYEATHADITHALGLTRAAEVYAKRRYEETAIILTWGDAGAAAASPALARLGRLRSTTPASR